MVIESPLWGEMSRSDREGHNFNKIMIKKEYIQPTVKAVKILLPTILAGSVDPLDKDDTEEVTQEEIDIIQ